jgi:hypothetical protein
MKAYYEFEYTSSSGEHKGKVFADSEFDAARIFYKDNPTSLIYIQTMRKIDFIEFEWKAFLRRKRVFITANFVLY